MSLQKCTAVTLLDLSAALETIHHSILLEHLSSWFGITPTTLVEILLAESRFDFTIDDCYSSSFQLLYGIP